MVLKKCSLKILICRKNKVNNCVFSTNVVRNCIYFGGKFWRNFMICYVVEHFWYSFVIGYGDFSHLKNVFVAACIQTFRVSGKL